VAAVAVAGADLPAANADENDNGARITPRAVFIPGPASIARPNAQQRKP